MIYNVLIGEVFTSNYIVEAENEEEAIKILINGGGEFEDGTFQYSCQLDPETWIITERKQNDT